MGKAYASELAQLPQVYEWAGQFDLGPITAAITALASKPLMIVGSSKELPELVKIKRSWRIARNLGDRTILMSLMAGFVRECVEPTKGRWRSSRYKPKWRRAS